MSSHAVSHRSHCQNCGASLNGPYCSELITEFWHLLSEILILCLPLLALVLKLVYFGHHRPTRRAT